MSGHGPTRQQRDVTQLLQGFRDGDPAALERLTPLLYDELRQLAQRHLRRERKGHTLQATALAHEAWLRLVGGSAVEWQGRAHFFAAAAIAIRRILVDHARAHSAAKRGSGHDLVQLEDELVGTEVDTLAVLDIDEALRALAVLDQRRARVVELRFFAGLEILEVAEVLGVSHATVERDWSFARAWLQCRMKGGAEAGDA